MAIEATAEQELRAAADFAWNVRWQIALDMNGDGAVTNLDVWLWLKWLILAPGDFLLLLLMKYGTSIALLLQIRPSSSLYSFLSVLVSITVWLFMASSAIAERAERDQSPGGGRPWH
jgi:hypothetical protein